MNAKKNDDETTTKDPNRIWYWLAGLLVGSIVVWVLLIAAQLFLPLLKKNEVQPIQVNFEFNPTLYHAQYRPHEEFGWLYKQEEVKGLFKKLQPELEIALQNAYQNARKQGDDALEKRISDTWSAVQGIGLISAIIGVLITVLVLYFSLQNAESINSTKENVLENANKIINELLQKTDESGNSFLKKNVEEQVPEVLKNLFKDKSFSFLERILDDPTQNKKLTDFICDVRCPKDDIKTPGKGTPNDLGITTAGISPGNNKK